VCLQNGRKGGEKIKVRRKKFLTFSKNLSRVFIMSTR
jgi:hypothetical protein